MTLPFDNVDELLNVQPGGLVLWASDNSVYFVLRTLGEDGVSTVTVRHERHEVEAVVFELLRWLETT